MQKPFRQFTSDNCSGICPSAWEMMEKSNGMGHAASYGADDWTERAAKLIREIFEIDCEVHFVYTGTAANAMALASVCRSYHSIVSHEMAHIRNDECGAPIFFSDGAQITPLFGPGAKIQVDDLDHLLSQPRDLRFAKHAALSLTQSTELGTVYTPDEVRALSQRAKASGLAVHMDGARFANAVAALNCTPAQLTHKAGVDVLCFGCTKNGISCGEAVVFFDREMALDFGYRCKQAGQVASKMRFITSQWVGLLENEVWLKNAAHANEMAKRLEASLQKQTKVKVVHPVEANAVFADIPSKVLETMHERGWELYTLAGSGGARLMCSWDTLAEDVDQLVRELQSAGAVS